jgi:hypothetical protein
MTSVRETDPDDVRREREERAVHDFSLERYKYILQQIHTSNENTYKFLAIYQALATTTVGAALVLFVSYRGWGIDPATVRTGVLGLILLETIIAGFTALLIFIGILTWLDYRSEECELTDKVVHQGFRKAPRVRNFFRWYETYIVLFILASTAFMWFFALGFVLPAIR